MNIKEKAKKFAEMAHKGQMRKTEPTKPMIIHPIVVAKILEDYGYDDNVVSAGYLHDVIEDTKYTLDDIKEQFGEDIANLVYSASETDKSLSWEERKQHTIDEIKEMPLRNKVVVCSDKIHNIESLTRLLKINGMQVFNSFKRGYQSQLWYFDNIYNSLVYNENEEEPIFIRFKKAIDELKKEIDYQLFLENTIFANDKEFYEKLRILHEKKYKLSELKQEVKLNKPFLIEFSGTPRTGKTSMLNALMDFFEKGGFKVQLVQELTTSSYYKSKILSKFRELPKYEGNILIIEEILKQLNKAISNSNTDIILYDRALFDRCIWMQRLLDLGIVDNKTSEAFMSKYLKLAKQNIDMLVLTYAKEEEALKRDYINFLALEQRSFLTIGNVEEYNKAMLGCNQRFRKIIEKVTLVDTTNITSREVLLQVAEYILNGINEKYQQIKQLKNK